MIAALCLSLVGYRHREDISHSKRKKIPSAWWASRPETKQSVIKKCNRDKEGPCSNLEETSNEFEMTSEGADHGECMPDYFNRVEREIGVKGACMELPMDASSTFKDPRSKETKNVIHGDDILWDQILDISPNAEQANKEMSNWSGRSCPQQSCIIFGQALVEESKQRALPDSAPWWKPPTVNDHGIEER